MAVLIRVREVLQAQRGHLFGWVPVCLAIGIGIYFALGFEPSPMLLGLSGAGGAALVLLARFVPGVGPVLVGCGLIAVGVALAGMRAHMVSEPVLSFRYYGPVEGRIVGIDRSSSDALRLTLDRVVLSDMPPGRTPTRVRVALHGALAGSEPMPGMTVMTTAHLAPPGGPVEPGGFDFQRHAWFQRLGAIGYTRIPVLALEPPDGSRPTFAARMALSRHVQARLPGEAGAFAAAIMTGDRAGMSQETLKALRVSNLAHLLAISGLHMGLLAGFLFAASRLLLAAIPWVALRCPVKKAAALIALTGAAGYLALSGGNVATERAFVMVAVMLSAILFDRRALSLRSVALAAVIVLVLRPEALLGPGFQMSFAATTALVAVFEWISRRPRPLGPGWAQPVVTVVISSLVAGLATAPFAAAHFNQIAHYGLAANLLSVPLMGVLVMPAAVLSAILMPFGLEGIGLWAMGLGLDWILGVARFFSGLEGARGTVPRPAVMVLPVLALGALFVVLWQGRSRMLGVVPLVLALVLWEQGERPDVLISEDGKLVGVMTDAGRALSRERGTGFVARNWLENDGDAAEQAEAATRWDKIVPGALPGGFEVIPVSGKRAVRAFDNCPATALVVMSAAPEVEGLPCRILSPKELRETGAVALYLRDGAPKMITARQVSGARLWNSGSVRGQ